MSPTTTQSTSLLQPILDGAIRSVSFFNGRLLTADDLSQEQAAQREARQRLGQAVGTGVAYGLEVAKPLTSTATQPTITVQPGLAVNPAGVALNLASPVEITLAQPAGNGGNGSGGNGFSECTPTTPTVYVAAGEGVHLLVIAPAGATEGRAQTSGLGNGNAPCNVRFNVEAVQFRLISITDLIPNDENGSIKLDGADARNRIAHKCFGTEDLRKFSKAVFGPDLPGYGILDSLRPNALTDCDVPLALVYWTGQGVQFVDMWAVRRRLHHAAGFGHWQPFVGTRRAAEAESMFLQFQDHLAKIREEAGVAPTLIAGQRFAYLPPAGLLPTGSGNFDWNTFLGTHAPSDVTRVDAGLLRERLLQAQTMDAFKFGQAPIVAVDVYRVENLPDFVLFARASSGRVRVTLSLALSAGQVVGITARGYFGERSRFFGGPGATFQLMDLHPGLYDLHVDLDGFAPETVGAVRVIGGLVTETPVTMKPLATGRIVIEVFDAETGQRLGVSGQAMPTVFVVDLGISIDPNVDGVYIIDGLAVGAHTLNISAPRYESQTLTLAVGADQTLEETVKLQKRGEHAETPPLCMRISHTRDTFLPKKTTICLRPDEIQLRPGTFGFKEIEVMTDIPSEAIEWLGRWQKYLAEQFPGAGIDQGEPAFIRATERTAGGINDRIIAVAARTRLTARSQLFAAFGARLGAAWVPVDVPD